METNAEGRKHRPRREDVQPKVYRLSALEVALDLRRTAIEDLVKSGDLAPPIRLGSKSKAWLVSDVDDFLARRQAERDAA